MDRRMIEDAPDIIVAPLLPCFVFCCLGSLDPEVCVGDGQIEVEGKQRAGPKIFIWGASSPKSPDHGDNNPPLPRPSLPCRPSPLH